MVESPHKHILIGIAGKKLHGKGTIANYLCKKHGFVQIAFADPIKQVSKQLFFLTDKQLTDSKEKEKIDPRWGITPRKIFQSVGQMFREGFGKNFWVLRCMFEVARIRSLPVNRGRQTRIVIPDVRYLNEIEAIRRAEGEVVKIERLNFELKDPHKSENELNDYKDYENIFKAESEDLFSIFSQVDKYMERFYV